MRRISACLFTLNDAHNLPRAIAWLAVTDEIVVMDAGSAGGSVTIAKQHSVAE